MDRLETYYEIIRYGGDARKANRKLIQLYPAYADLMSLKGPVNDNGRFFDLTAVISEEADTILYHRLDRLTLTLQ